ncbi:hypothetical protein N7523_004723 [Penicillium sp. IBT 18751x]|nr:hypothetical protein N7523_004723 [Penicillium sp. IBT 18751x]
MSAPGNGPSAPAAARSRHRRRGRGPSNRGGLQDTPATLTNEQSAPQTSQQQSDITPISEQPNSQSRSRRSNKEGRGSGRRGGRGNGIQRGGQGQTADQNEESQQLQSRAMRARGFGARLTRSDQDGIISHPELVAEADASLRADAPDFVPGPLATSTQPVPPSTASAKGKGKTKAKLPPKSHKVTTKSTAGDIATRIHEDIAHNLYECPICTSELGRRSKVWSCELCWTVFHLSCIKKWSTNEGAAAQRNSRQQDGDEPVSPPAGVKKKSTLDPSLVCLHIRAVRHAHGLGRVARIRAIQLVTQVLVLLVHRWDQLKIVSAVGIRLPNDAKIPTMKKDGAVVRSVVISSRVVNTHVPFRVTRGCVAPVRSQ